MCISAPQFLHQPQNNFLWYIFPLTLLPCLSSPLSTTVLVPASCGAALAPVPSSPHFWQVTSWSIGLTWLAVSTQMCSHLSFPVLCQWLGPLLSLRCCSVGFSLSSVLSPVLSSPSLRFNFSFFLLLFCTIINLHRLIQKMLLPCQPCQFYSVLHLIVFKLLPNPTWYCLDTVSQSLWVPLKISLPSLNCNFLIKFLGDILSPLSLFALLFLLLPFLFFCQKW